MSTSYIPRQLRAVVAEQARRRCGYCLTAEWIVGSSMEIDHILPESLGGLTILENLWLACSLCNDHKNDRISGLDPETNGLVRFFNPRTQKWGDHFMWSKQGDTIIGLTSAGRATVVTLNLNRLSLVNARQAWVSVGWHPPTD